VVPLAHQTEADPEVQHDREDHDRAARGGAAQQGQQEQDGG